MNNLNPYFIKTALFADKVTMSTLPRVEDGDSLIIEFTAWWKESRCSILVNWVELQHTALDQNDLVIERFKAAKGVTVMIERRRKGIIE